MGSIDVGPDMIVLFFFGSNALVGGSRFAGYGAVRNGIFPVRRRVY
jgi:hypothetical protein